MKTDADTHTHHIKDRITKVQAFIERDNHELSQAAEEDRSAIEWELRSWERELLMLMRELDEY